jgi:hypothetical protein
MAIKLSEWAKRNGITYATCYRWHKEGTMPVKSYSTATGTIFVEDDNKDGITSIELFLKQVVKFSSENKSIVEFSAFVLDNFNLSMKNIVHTVHPSEAPAIAKQEVQNHIKDYIESVMPEEKKEKIRTLKDSIKTKTLEASIDENIKLMIINEIDASNGVNVSEEDIEIINEMKDKLKEGK